MAFCTKCGAQMGDQATFCSQCGTAHTPAGGTPAPSGAQGGGLTENTAATLCYALWWVTGLIFLLVDKRPYVKFHAAQSLVTFGALHVLTIVFGVFFGLGFSTMGFHALGPALMLLYLIRLGGVVLWIFLMIKASQGNKFKLPVAGDLAENIAGK